MRRYQKPSSELRQLFNQEWKRAKRTLSPLLDNKEKPRLYVAKSLKRGWIGIHFGRDGVLAHKINGRWVRGAHVIGIRLGWDSEASLVNTIRHEICHVLEQNHRSRFRQLLKLLYR